MSYDEAKRIVASLTPDQKDAVCELIRFADVSFYSGYGGEDAHGTIQNAITDIQTANMSI